MLCVFALDLLKWRNAVYIPSTGRELRLNQENSDETPRLHEGGVGRGPHGGERPVRRMDVVAASGSPEDKPERPRDVVRGDMRYRPLGKTGEEVSTIGVGGYHIGVPKDEAEGIKIIRTAIDAGVTFMDNCWDYNDGGSEIRMGKALRDGYRKKVFLMTKIDGRTKESAAKQIDESLKRLQVDVIDLLQHHEVIRMEDPDRIFADGGAMEAFAGSEEGRQDPLHRLHRSQGPAGSSANARGRRQASASISTPCRCR